MQKYKKNEKMSYSLGTTLTLELLNNKVDKVRRIYIHSKQKKSATYKKIEEICKINNIQIFNDDKIFNILSDKENCYVIGEFNKYDSNIDLDTNHIVLDSPSNMGNFGTIIRTSRGFGITNIAIIRPAVDIFNPKVVRASMGAIFGINFEYFDSFEEYSNKVSERKLYPFMLNGKSNLLSIKVPERYSLIFGNEASGLPNKYENIGESILISHSKNIDSLNLDNAVSIALYEFTKKDFR